MSVKSRNYKRFPSCRFVFSEMARNLYEHLLPQAPRAAARLFSHLTLENVTPHYGTYFVVPEQVVLVASEDSVACFVAALRALLEGPPTTIGIDLEWRPDTHSLHRPSLLQLATQSRCWLLDLEASSCCTGEPLDAVAAVLSSSKHRLLGFGLQGDLDRLQLVYRHGEHPPLIARHVVDLRDACLAASSMSCLGGSAVHPSPPSAGGGTSGGLAARLRSWTGYELDKSMQTSDWRRRPLTAEQIAYAAADARCLLDLDSAIAAWVAAGPHAEPRVACELCARQLTRACRRQSSGRHDAVVQGTALTDDVERGVEGAEGLGRVCAAMLCVRTGGATCWLSDAPSAAAGSTSAEEQHAVRSTRCASWVHPRGVGYSSWSLPRSNRRSTYVGWPLSSAAPKAGSAWRARRSARRSLARCRAACRRCRYALV